MPQQHRVQCVKAYQTRACSGSAAFRIQVEPRSAARYRLKGVSNTRLVMSYLLISLAAETRKLCMTKIAQTLSRKPRRWLRTQRLNLGQHHAVAPGPAHRVLGGLRRIDGVAEIGRPDKARACPMTGMMMVALAPHRSSLRGGHRGAGTTTVTENDGIADLTDPVAIAAVAAAPQSRTGTLVALIASI